jgi:hypothetical protein
MISPALSIVTTQVIPYYEGASHNFNRRFHPINLDQFLASLHLKFIDVESCDMASGEGSELSSGPSNAATDIEKTQFRP